MARWVNLLARGGIATWFVMIQNSTMRVIIASIKWAFRSIRLIVRLIIGLLFLSAILGILADINRPHSEIGPDELEDLHQLQAEAPQSQDEAYQNDIDSALYMVRFELQRWQKALAQQQKDESVAIAAAVRARALELRTINPPARYVAYDVHIDQACDYLMEFAKLYKESIQFGDRQRFDKSRNSLAMFALKMNDAEREKERIGWKH